MKQGTKAQDFCNLLAACEEAINGEMSSNTGLSICLNLFIAQCSGSSLQKDDLKKKIAAPDSSVERYIAWMKKEGLLEKPAEEGADEVLMLSENVSSKYETLFTN